MNQREIDIASYAGSFMIGMRDCDFDVALRKWDQGCVELTYQLVKHVGYFVDLMDRIGSVRGIEDQGHPGVIDYEVTEPFGVWFTDIIITTGTAPPDDDCQNWLKAKTAEFFSKPDWVASAADGERAAIAAAISSFVYVETK